MSIQQTEVWPFKIDWDGLFLTQRFMNPGELEVLISLVASVNPKAVLEIGVNEGRTARAILSCISTVEQYQGIDVLPGYIPSMKVQRKEVPKFPGWMAEGMDGFELILRNRGSLDLCIGDLKRCDAVFIDGDHGRAAVMWDTYLARNLIRSGGIIIWHDYHDRGNVDVAEVLREYSAQGHNLMHVKDTWLVYEKITK